MAKLKSITLSEDLDSPQEIGGETYHCWKFTNPQGAQVRCEAVAGKGEISLYKNNTKIGLPYQISSDPGHPTAIHLNTGNWVKMSAAQTVIMQGDTLLKIARRFGVTIKNLRAINGLSKSGPVFPGMVLRIPPSEWEVWIKEIEPAKPGKNKFKVKLLSE
jgi:LysM domain-containing protein